MVPFPIVKCIVFGRKEIAGSLKIMRDPCQTSSYCSLEPYCIGCQLCETNHFPLFLIYLIYVIFELDLLTPVHFLCTSVSLSLYQ